MTTPAADDQPAARRSSEPVDTLPELQTRSLAEKEEDARRSIAHRLVWAYILLLAFSIVIPTALMWIPHVTGGASITDARDLMLAMSGTLSGLVGILGFVMGYYFKSLDKPTEATAPRRRPGSK